MSNLEGIINLRKAYQKNEQIINELSDNLQKKLTNHRKLEERTARLEKKITTQMLDIKSLEKQCSSLKNQISEQKALNEPEKNQIKNSEGFVKASKSIFTAKAFENLDKNPSTQQFLTGKSGELLIDIAKISESVNNLKKNIVDLKRTEIELKDLQSAGRNKQKNDIALEIINYNKNTVKVKHKNLQGIEYLCEFPTVDNLGNKLRFEKLLENACRYWDLNELECVLMDEEFIIWAGSKYVEEEITSTEKEVWLLLKEEASYLRTINSKDKPKITDKYSEIELDNEIINENTEGALIDNESKVKEILQNDMDIVKTKQNQERRKNVLNLLLYGLFIGVFTWALLQSNQIEVSYKTIAGLNNSMFFQLFPANSSTQVTFNQINLYQDFESFMSEPLVNTLFQDKNYNNVPFNASQRNFINNCYKKIGPVRFLQKKVIIGTCDLPTTYLGRDIQECFNDMSSNNEYRAELNIQEIKYKDWLSYKSFSSPRLLIGVLNTYKLEGYVAYLQPGITNAQALEEIKLIYEYWIDLQTRLLVIDSNFCNYNSDMCISIEIVFEFVAGGGVLASKKIETFRVNLMWTELDKIRIAFDCVAGAILFYYLVQFFSTIKAQGWKKSFTSTWNILLILMSLMTFVKHMLYIAYQNEEIIRDFKEDNNEFVDYMSTANFYGIISNFTGISSFIAYFYILSYFQESKSLKVIWGTLGHAVYKLLFFFLVFLLVFTGWMLLAYKGYGQYLYNYRNLGSTSNTLLQMLLGNVNFDELYNIQAEFAGVFFFLFMFLNYFVMLNIFLAIINESYEHIYKKLKSDNENDEMLIILGILLQGVKYCFITFPINIVRCNYCRKYKGN